MSKHDKHVRRERKKTDRARRLMARFRPTSEIRHPTSVPAALAAAAAIAAGTAAYAAPVRFDNPPGPGHFEWASPDPSEAPDLVVVLPAASQTGDSASPSSFGQHVSATAIGRVTGRQGGELQVVGAYSDLIGVDAGVLIPSGYSWNFFGYSYYPGYGSYLPEGQQTYLGVRFDFGSGSQYGWIGVERTGMELDAFAWGYETEVGVPIPAGIPEPGSLALLAFGALAVCRRRP